MSNEVLAAIVGAGGVVMAAVVGVLLDGKRKKNGTPDKLAANRDTLDLLRDGADKLCLLGKADELGRVEDASYRMTPPYERFNADHPAVHEADLRLVLQEELVREERITDIGKQPDATDGAVARLVLGDAHHLFTPLR